MYISQVSGEGLQDHWSSGFIFFHISVKTYIVGTRWNRLAEVALTSTHNVCFGSKVRKLDISLHTPVLLYKSGVEGGIQYTDMLS